MTALTTEVFQYGTVQRPVQIVEVLHPGPPGAPGGATRLAELLDVDVGGKVNNSLLVYSASTQKFTANGSTTTTTLTDGGNF